MIGKEIADAITPFVMWITIAGTVIFLIIFGIKQWNKGVIAKDDLGEAQDAAEDNREASDDFDERVDTLSDLFNAELSNEQDPKPPSTDT